jgi:phosphatidylserine/phosphatidylglycerophosphate/cardiolipin synthase-like enzyme
MQHIKRTVCDSDLTLFGSYNLDPLSAWLNSEVTVAVWSRELALANAASIQARIDGGKVLEYRIKRDAEGRPLRWPEGHPQAGQVIVAFGPKNHLPQKTLDELAQTKALLVSIRGIWDFEWVVW